MSSTISAGITVGTAIAISGDTSGSLVLQTNGTTPAVTISTGQVVTLAQPLPVASGGSGVTTSTGTGAVVLGTSPTLTTPTINSLSSASATGLTLQSAGTTAITVDTSQNVGIGTSSSGSYGKLTVNAVIADTIGSSVTTTALLVQDTSLYLPHLNVLGKRHTAGTDWNGVGLRIQQQVQATNMAYIEFNPTASAGGPTQAMAFGNNTTEYIRIDSNGNVGIGTASPAYKLDVTGQGRATTGFAVSTDGSTFTPSGLNAIPNYGVGYITSTSQTVLSGYGGIPFYTNQAERMRIDSSGALILAGSTAQKATGTTWSNPSDKRIKDNIRDYTKGTTELMQVRVREWEYNGKGGTTEGIKGLGVIADEVMMVLPNTVENYTAKLNVDDEETTDIKKFDATEITWLLVKTVQEQQALITTLTARITALEVK